MERTASALSSSYRRRTKVLVGLFLLLAVGIGAAAFFYLSQQERTALETARKNVQTIAELKVSQIVEWREDYLTYGQSVSENALVLRSAMRVIEGRTSAEERQDLTDWMRLRTRFGYDGVFLLDAAGEEILWAGENKEQLGVDARVEAMETMRQGAVQLEKIHATFRGDLFFDTIVPLRHGGRSIGAFVLRADPRRSLFPLIERWPVPSETGEVILARRENGEVVLINRMRGDNGREDFVRYALTDRHIMTVMAARGQRGVMNGVDYEGKRVFAALEPIPDSSWYLVVKIDEQEIYQALSFEKLVAVTVVVALLLAMGAAITSIWRRQRVEFEFRQREALREGERRFRTALENADFIAVQLDSQGRILFCNDYLLTLTGWRREEVMGEDWFSRFIPPSELGRVRGAFADLMSTKRFPEHFENPIVTRSGEERVIHWNNTMLFDEEGGTTGINSIGEDITEQRRAEERIRESEEFFRSVFDNSSDAIMIADADRGIIVDANRQAEQLMGRSRAELIGMDRIDLHPPGDVDRYQRQFRNHVEARGARSEASEIATRDGRRVPVEISASVVDLPGGRRAIIGTFRDITERRALEEERRRHAEELERIVLEQTTDLERARAELFASAKLAAMGRMSAGIAHQLNSPLGGAMLLIDAMAETCRGNTSHEEICGKAREALLHMKQIIDCMLTLAMVPRRGRPPAADIDLNQALEHILAFARHECAQRNVMVHPSYAPALPSIRGRVGELDQVFLNLVNNALDAMPRGGTLTVKTRSTGDAVEVLVQDTGEGISPDHLERIFEPFFTTRRARRGVGLGLAIAHEITGRYGGEIRVESAVGKGTTFIVSLPLSGIAERDEASGDSVVP